MEEQIVEAVNEMKCAKYETLEQVREDYTKAEIFNLWLHYEGIIGYTDTILRAVDELRIDPSRDRTYGRKE
jgi:hypothetical protein